MGSQKWNGAWPYHFSSSYFPVPVLSLVLCHLLKIAVEASQHSSLPQPGVMGAKAKNSSDKFQGAIVYYNTSSEVLTP